MKNSLKKTLELTREIVEVIFVSLLILLILSLLSRQNLFPILFGEMFGRTNFWQWAIPTVCLFLCLSIAAWLTKRIEGSKARQISS